MNDIETTAAIILAGLLSNAQESRAILRSVDIAKSLRSAIDQDDGLAGHPGMQRLEQENFEMRAQLKDLRDERAVADTRAQQLKEQLEITKDLRDEKGKLIADVTNLSRDSYDKKGNPIHWPYQAHAYGRVLDLLGVR